MLNILLLKNYLFFYLVEVARLQLLILKLLQEKNNFIENYLFVIF